MTLLRYGKQSVVVMVVMEKDMVLLDDGNTEGCSGELFRCGGYQITVSCWFAYNVWLCSGGWKLSVIKGVIYSRHSGAHQFLQTIPDNRP